VSATENVRASTKIKHLRNDTVEAGSSEPVSLFSGTEGTEVLGGGGGGHELIISGW
jgi:hypothetical protein